MDPVNAKLQRIRALLEELETDEPIDSDDSDSIIVAKIL
jgi:hypothetical protein